jgi:hypothetical protein
MLSLQLWPKKTLTGKVCPDKFLAKIIAPKQ